MLFFVLLFLPLDNVPPVYPLSFPVFVILGVLQFEGLLKGTHFLLCIIKEILIRLHIFSYVLIQRWELLLSGVSDAMSDYLPKVLQGGVEGKFWFQLFFILIFFVGQIKGFNELTSRYSL